MELNKVYCENCLDTMKRMTDNSVDLIVTSPNYNNWRNRRTQAKKSALWARTNIVYDNCPDNQSDEVYEKEQITIINEMVRILKPTGTICYNHKDKIFNFEVKSPIEWILKSDAKYRQRITWNRGGTQAINPVRFFRVEEDIYILGKSGGRAKWNKEFAKYLSIWNIAPNKNSSGHPATFPEELARRCIEAFTNEGDLVYDPFSGSGTTWKMSILNNRQFVGSEMSPKYVAISETRVAEYLPTYPELD